MFVALWEFEVKPGCGPRFEKAYGPAGDWARLFRRDPHFRGTRLLRDPSHKLRFVTLDFWDSRKSYDAFQRRYRQDYLALDQVCEPLTRKERCIGWFSGMLKS